MPAVKQKPQSHMDEKLLEDDNLEQLLHEREAAKEGFNEARGEFADADRKAHGTIEARDPPLVPGNYRCGPFIINISHRDPKAISFTRKGGVSTRIRHLSNGTD